MIYFPIKKSLICLSFIIVYSSFIFHPLNSPGVILINDMRLKFCFLPNIFLNYLLNHLSFYIDI